MLPVKVDLYLYITAAWRNSVIKKLTETLRMSGQINLKIYCNHLTVVSTTSTQVLFKSKLESRRPTRVEDRRVASDNVYK